MTGPAVASVETMEAPPAMDEARKRELQGKLAVIVQRLEKKAEDRVAHRKHVESRWIEDLTQYHGKYDSNTSPDQRAKGGARSRVFMGKTRQKTNAFAARLIDMLQPTDDRNWDIQPTPVPSTTAQAKRAVAEAEKLAKRADQEMQAGNPELGMKIVAVGDDFAAAAAKIKAEQDEAKRRCDAMRDEMDDQLVEGLYQQECRDVIEDAAKLGTGVLKGPVKAARVNRQWRTVKQEGRTLQVLEDAVDNRPTFLRVDPWAWFPSADARSVKDSEDFFERHLWTAKDLRKLARRGDFDKDAIRRLLDDQSRSTAPQYLIDLRSIAGQQIDATVKRWIGWEYTGPLEAQDLADISACIGDGEMLAEAEKADPLQEIHVVIWFCQGELLKIDPHPLDSGDPLYSAFCIEKDEASIWGYGIPYMMRDSQRALNAAWRMMLDNAGASAGPQIVIDPDKVEPLPGDDHTIRGFKVWLGTELSDTPGKGPFQVYNFDSHQAELANIIQISERFIDDETGLPLVAQGESGAHVTKTMGGMSMLMNSANVVLRRVVKNFDDDLTVPTLRRQYDWNMQFSNREDIKGDFSVQARGSSVLLVRELQAQNLMQLLPYAGHPIFGPMLKPLPLFRRTIQSLMLDAREIVVTEDELAQNLAKQAQNAPPDPEVMKLELQERIADKKFQNDQMIEQLRHETAMMTLAETMNMDLEKLKAMLIDRREERSHKERKIAAEIAVESHAPQQVKLA